MNRSLTGLVIPLVLGVSACDSPMGFVGTTGEFELITLGGAPLPTIGFENEYVTLVVLADTLRFTSETRGVHVRHIEVASDLDSATSSMRDETPFGYRIKGDRLEVSYICPPNANCLAGPHLVGSIGDGMLRLSTNVGWAEHVYRRIGGD